MALVSPANFEAQSKYLRAGARLNSRVPVAVEWSDAAQVVRAEGYTVDVSPKGCLAVVQKEIPVGQRVCLVNSAMKNECEAIVVRCDNQGKGAWELALELQDGGLDFWGLEF